MKADRKIGLYWQVVDTILVIFEIYRIYSVSRNFHFEASLLTSYLSVISRQTVLNFNGRSFLKTIFETEKKAKNPTGSGSKIELRTPNTQPQRFCIRQVFFYLYPN